MHSQCAPIESAFFHYKRNGWVFALRTSVSIGSDISEKHLSFLWIINKFERWILTWAIWSNRPKSSFKVFTRSEAESCSDRGVKLTMSAYKMLSCAKVRHNQIECIWNGWHRMKILKWAIIVTWHCYGVGHTCRETEFVCASLLPGKHLPFLALCFFLPTKHWCNFMCFYKMFSIFSKILKLEMKMKSE